MIPDPKNPHPEKETFVIDILSRTPRLTVKQLYEQFSQKWPKKMTLQGFYRLLAELQKKRVIVKDGKLLSIDAGWVHAVMDFSERLKATYLQANPTTANILVGEGESTSFEFPTVIDMDNYWYHALVIVTHYYAEHPSDDVHVYNYNDHCWYQVIRSGSEQALGDTYAHMGLDWYLVAGSSSYIDGLVSGMIQGKAFHYTQSEKLDFPENYYVVVIGDFIFETELPKYIFEMMESVYDRVQAITDPALQSIEDLIRLPAKTTLKISCNAKRAEEIRTKIKDAF
jgi:hypothetical protein